MRCVKSCGQLLAGVAASSSILGILLLPKCPVCLLMYLAAIGMTGLSAYQMGWGITGIFVVLLAALGWRLTRRIGNAEKISRSDL